MVRLISILVLTLHAFLSFAQTEVKEIPLEEIKGIFVLYWEISNTSFIGEEIRINKRKKFEYSVFSTYPGIINKSAEQTIVKGKYKITNDTLSLYAVTKPPWGAEMFNLNSKYLIRAIQISNPIGRNRTITCLIDPEKLESFEQIVLQLPSIVENYYAKANDVLLVKHLNEIGLDAEILFYQESIFIKD